MWFTYSTLSDIACSYITRRLSLLLLLVNGIVSLSTGEWVWIDLGTVGIWGGLGNPFETALLLLDATKFAWWTIGSLNGHSLWTVGLAALGVLGGAGAALELEITIVSGLWSTALTWSLINDLILLVSKIIVLLGHNGGENGEGGEKLNFSIILSFNYKSSFDEI